MRIQWRAVHTLKEEVASLSAWEAQSQRELDEWTEDTEGTTLPAVDAFSEAFGTYRRDLEAAAEAVEALERLATAIEALDDAPERKRYIGAYDAALSALEQRLFCDNYGDRHGPVTAAQTTADELIKPAREAVREEIARRRREAAEREAARQAAAARREAEECKRKAIAEADAARAVLAASMPELDAATAPPTAVAE